MFNKSEFILEIKLGLGLDLGLGLTVINYKPYLKPNPNSNLILGLCI